MAGRVTALATDADLRPLWVAIHERLCRGGATPRTVVTVRDAGPDTRRAVDRLLGRVSSAGALRVQLGTLDDALARAGTNSAAVAAAAVGPVTDRKAARAAAAESATATWGQLLQHPAASEPALAAWLEALRDSGRLNRVGGADAITSAFQVLAVLPLDLPTGRQVLAAGVLGQEHALDDGTPVGRLVVAGIAARNAVPTPTDAAGRAALWSVSGITLDAVSAPALTLGLRPLPMGPITEAAARWADGGVPLPIPAAALIAEPWALAADTLVSVCENPSVLEAAAEKLGAAAPPLVCVSGMPGRAVTTLLTQFVGAGATLRYHGDFGTGGITIANLIVSRHRAEPWRMSTQDHRRAAARLAALGREPTALRGSVPDAVWDNQLAPAVIQYGREITEEHVLDDLLGDLANTD